MRTPGSGRQPGTPNKNTKALLEKAEELGVDPFELLCHIAKGDWKAFGLKMMKRTETVPGQTLTREVDVEPEISFEDRFRAIIELAGYLYPKRKAVALSADEDSGFKIIIEDFTKKEPA